MATLSLAFWRKKPAPKSEQVEVIEATKKQITEEVKADEPMRFYSYGNSLCIVGKPPWPPVLRDNASYERSEIYEHIADALNVKHRYSFVRRQLGLTVAAYERGDIDKQKVADDLFHMLQIIRADEKRDEPIFAKHERTIADYERRNGNWGG